MRFLYQDFLNGASIKREKVEMKASYYNSHIESFLKSIIPSGKKVVKMGCGKDDLLYPVKLINVQKVNTSNAVTKIAGKRYPKKKFVTLNLQNLPNSGKFDYIILSEIIGNLWDIQKTFDQLYNISNKRSRILITSYNFLWEPIVNIAEALRLKEPKPKQNWLSGQDIENFLYLSNLEIVKRGGLILFPLKLPLISSFLNRYVARMPLIKHLCLVQYFIIRKGNNQYLNEDFSVSVIIPARNESGNIEQAVLRIPKLGKSTEIIFVEGGSIDNTVDEIKRVIKKYYEKDIKLVIQKKTGKGDAVRRGFEKAKGDILMILDADLTVAPEDMLKFYQAIRLRKGELVMGSRLIYPLEDQAMRFLNILGNKFFSIMFSFLLDQPIKDTLCGTKVIYKKDYQELAKNRRHFGDFDPFGDFDLIFGASRLNLKILEIPIHYKARTYGVSNISRFKHGWMLLKMTFFAARKIKFI